jgi:hypothetical protein
VSRLAGSRQLIVDALEAANLNPATTQQWAAPAVIVEPGDPWAAVDLSLGRRRTGRWLLTIVTGSTDTAGAFEELAELVDRTDAALLTVPGVELPTWARPSDRSLDGALHASSSATIQLLTPRPEEVLP